MLLLKPSLTLQRVKTAVYIFTAGLSLLSVPATAETAPEAALRLIQNEEWGPAREAVIQSGNPILFKLYEWSLYREPLANLPFDRIVTFIQQNPNWPDQPKLLATAERNMPDALPAAQMISWFMAHPPVTGDGILKLANAATETQNQSAIAIINTAWPNADMDSQTQSDIVSRYGRWINADSYNARFDYLLKDTAYTMARGLASSLQNGYPQLVEARIALAEQKRGAEDFIYNVPRNLQNNTGLLFERIRWMRRNDGNAAAATLLNTASHAGNITFPKEWWKERNILVRRLMEDKNYSKAYNLASQHNMDTGPEFAEAEWISGWLALRFLNRPELAMQHFTNMYGKVETSISRSRGAYWAGRAADALRKPEDAKTWYYQAATYPHTYYGQIALGHLKMTSAEQTPVIATPNDQSSISSSDLVQAAALLHQAGYESLSVKFINAKLEQMSTPGEFQAFANYLKRVSDTSGAYRVAKKASWKNIFLGDTAYPSLSRLMSNISIDQSLAHGIIRQESQFDPNAESPAGALGLMQLMPGTAKEVAQKRGWDHQTDWLTSRPSHNVSLGSAYLNDLLKRFNGSYPLAIAAYNAGPSRVKSWLEVYGDPRMGEVDWIDWIELIPVAETRNYVQRVTEGVVTYRDHLDMDKTIASNQ